jgi:hypothetical protein
VIWCDHLVGPAAQLQPIRCEVDSGRPAGLSTTTRSVTVAIPRRRSCRQPSGSSARAPAPDGSCGPATRFAAGRETPRPPARPARSRRFAHPRRPSWRPYHLGDGLQLIGIHQRLPAFRQLHYRLAGPLRHARASRTLGLLRRLRPTPRPTAGDGPAPPPNRRARWPGRPRVVPTFTGSSIGQIGAQLHPASLATPTP